MERVDYESLIVNDLLGYFARQELNITPWYQRRSVWTRPQKSYLINTLHENKPIPALYIRSSIDIETERSIKEVVDGQQRVRCIIEYKANSFPASHPNHSRPVTYAELSTPERAHFLQSPLSVGYLIGATDQEVIEIFARINSVSKTLNPQEKRNARFSGAFKQFCVIESVAHLAFWRNNKVFTDSQIARMLEVQLVSDLVLNLEQGLQDYSAHKLNKYYAQYDDDFPHAADLRRRLNIIFNTLVNLPEGLIQSTIFSSPQVLFSLMIVIDRIGPPRKQALIDCISDLDSRVESVRSREEPPALDPDVYAAFSSGNLHRIRARTLRDKAISKFFV